MLVLVYFVLFFFCLIGLRSHKEYNIDYLAIDRCNSVKGFFIIIVFIRHINQYILNSRYHFSNLGDLVYFKLDSLVGQFLVVMFLFFSGYGIMESYKKKGDSYVDTMPRKRVLTTLLNFDIAVLAFIIFNLLLGKSMSLKQILLSFLAWDSVGNSNWYIFCIILCYTLSFAVLYLYNKFFCLRNVYIYALLPIFFLSIVAMIVLSCFKAPYWYNTMLCFPFGMLYSEMKGRIERIVQLNYFGNLIILIVILLILRYIPISLRGLGYNLEALVFAMIVVLLMMRIELDNRWLQWMGQKLFPLYIYQRLSMMTIYELPGGKSFISSYPLIYIMICFICVLIIASQYYRWQIKLS